MSNSTRRRKALAMVVPFVGTSLVLAACGTGTTSSAEGSGGGQLSYWYNEIFSEEANRVLEEQVHEWAAANDVDVELVAVNGNDTTTKVSAALTANQLPDLLDMNDNLLMQLGARGVMADLTTLYEEIGQEHGGWQAMIQEPDDYPAYGLGIPFGIYGNVLFARQDLLEEAGVESLPTTWVELAEIGAQVQSPPDTYAMGFALSNSPDAEYFVETILHSYGARVADDEGTQCTLDSPETAAALSFIKDSVDQGLFPPDVAVWDGSGDNNAYQSGQAAFIQNTGSVALYLEEEDPELAESTAYSTLPAGPEHAISPATIWTHTIPAQSENRELAESLIRHLSEPENIEEYLEHSIYGPVTQDYAEFGIFQEESSPVLAGLKQLAEEGTLLAYPDTYNEAYAEYHTSFQAARMAQAVVVNGVSVPDAISDAQDACQEIYDSHQ